MWKLLRREKLQGTYKDKEIRLNLWTSKEGLNDSLLLGKWERIIHTSDRVNFGESVPTYPKMIISDLVRIYQI